jgi:hypothetical protein
LGKAVKIKRYTETKEAMHIEDTQRGELQRRLKCQRLCIAFSSEKVAAAAITARYYSSYNTIESLNQTYIHM